MTSMPGAAPAEHAEVTPDVAPEEMTGAIVVGDNVNLDPNQAYLNYIHAPENGYVSTPLPLDKGLELAVRVGP
jgi:hypothetical protein